MVRRLFGAVAALAVVAALAGAAVAYAASTGQSTSGNRQAAPAAYGPMPAASRPGNCPHMNGGSSSSGTSGGSGTAPGSQVAFRSSV
jgi:hypothetical protein